MIRFIRRTISASSSSAWPSSTISRRAAVQRWPAVRKADWTTSTAAAAMSAGRQTTSGLLPPISSARMRSGRSANWRLSATPVVDDPVNSRPSMPGCAASPLPTSTPPCTTDERILRHAGCVEQADERLADRRRLFRRLEDDRVAGEQCGHDVAVGQVGGEIVGAEHRQHPVRFVPDRVLGADRAFKPPLRRALRIGRDRDVDLAHHRLGLGRRLPQRLAGLARDQIGEVVEPGAHPVGEPPQRLRAIGQRLGRPTEETGAGAPHRFVHITARAVPQQRAGGGFVGGQLSQGDGSNARGF